MMKLIVKDLELEVEGEHSQCGAELYKLFPWNDEHPIDNIMHVYVSTPQKKRQLTFVCFVQGYQTVTLPSASNSKSTTLRHGLQEAIKSAANNLEAIHIGQIARQFPAFNVMKFPSNWVFFSVGLTMFAKTRNFPHS